MFALAMGALVHVIGTFAVARWFRFRVPLVSIGEAMLHGCGCGVMLLGLVVLVVISLRGDAEPEGTPGRLRAAAAEHQKVARIAQRLGLAEPALRL